MELPANTSPTTSTELEQLGKEQVLGEAKYLGCPGFDTPDAITTAVSRDSTKTSGKTAIKRYPATATPAAISTG